MTSVRRGLQQIGGRNAISIWSWIITIPLTILVSSTYAGTPSVPEVLVWQGIVLAVHGLLGGVMWMAAKTILPNRERPSRPLVALGFFAFLGLARGLLLQAAQDSVGISGGVFSERLAVNIVGSMVALAAIAIVVDDYRTDEAIVQRLESARRTLTRLRDEQETALRAADIDVLEQVQERIESELGAAGADPARVRAIADEIVRPISHELAESDMSRLPSTSEESGPRVRLTFGDAFGLMKAPSPLAVAVIVEATIIGAVAVRFGIQVAVVNAMLGGGLIFLGCWALVRFLPLAASPWWRLITLVLALAAVAIAATLVAASIVTPLQATFPAGWIGVAVGVVGAGIALSLWSAVNAGRAQRQQELAQVVAEEASEVERLSTVIEERRLQAARFLHGPIQGELIAAALRRDNPDEVRATVARRFSDYGEIPERSVEFQVRNVLDAWASILEITFQAEPIIWQLLEVDSRRSTLLVDALSEGLTNVVRHSAGREVLVSVEPTGRSLELRVRSMGSSGSQRNSGWGLDQLEARGADVALEGTTDFTELIVIV